MAGGESVVGRLAPSPTGRLHLGHARSFLLAWWSARSQGGRVLLRVEDLDETRVKEGATELVLRDLEWLGLDWDGEVQMQSERTEAHRAALDSLVESGRAYPCVCTRKEIEESASAPHPEGGETPYPGTCRGRFASVADARASSGRDVALRLVVDPGEVRFDDRFLGEQAIDVAAECGDFVIGRKHGLAAYQLATPLDDAASGVTEVVRGADLVSSAARQRLVLAALRLEAPEQVHVPLVHGPDGRRLAKRAGSLSLEELREQALAPEQVVSWAARASGLDPLGAGAPGSAADWLERFAWSRVPREPVVLPEAPFRDDAAGHGSGGGSKVE